jgi:toxin ParE1/3/4
VLDLTIRPRARRDLREIWQYTRRTWSRQQADHYISNLKTEMEKLRKRPSLGRARDDLSPGLLRKIAERHAIYYRVRDDRLLVVRVLHGNMDPIIHLANDDT